MAHTPLQKFPIPSALMITTRMEGHLGRIEEPLDHIVVVNHGDPLRVLLNKRRSCVVCSLLDSRTCLGGPHHCGKQSRPCTSRTFQ